MNKSIKFLTLSAFAGIATASQALVFNMDFVYTGADPGGDAPWATVTITDVAANKINLRIDHNATSAAGQFISNLYLNLNPFFASMTISNEINSNKRNGALQFSNNGINGAAGNNFDMAVPFDTSGSGGGVNRLKPGEFWSADLTATGLTASAFNVFNNKGNYVGAHLQGIAGGLSGHISTVPEPATMAALGLGGLALIRRRRQK